MGEINGIASNAIMPKTENIFSIFISFSAWTQNFSRFEEKDQLHSLNISEVIEPDKFGYFNFRELLFQNALR